LDLGRHSTLDGLKVLGQLILIMPRTVAKVAVSFSKPPVTSGQVASFVVETIHSFLLFVSLWVRHDVAWNDALFQTGQGATSEQ